MCLILLAYKQHPKYKLILIANRDEFYERPTKEAQWWSSKEEILAGKDLEGGGSWLGINRSGKFAALTNYRDPFNIKNKAPTRGHLVTNYLENRQDDITYMGSLERRGHSYNGFNLLFGDANQVNYYSNYHKSVMGLEAGIYGLSNALLDTPWPKVVKGKEKLKRLIENGNDFSIENAFENLCDSALAEDDKLPDTGIGYDREKAISSMFIETSDYGTRCSSIILIDYDNKVSFHEKSYIPEGYVSSDFEIKLT